jgi:outer membrane protein assembly factor BamB
MELDAARMKDVVAYIWKVGYGNPAGILTTAGGLLFTSNSGYLVALDAMDGKTVWKTNVGGPATNAPITY